MKINDKIHEAIVDQIGKLIADYQEEIERAYSGPSDLTVRFAVRLSPGKGSDIDVKTKMSFTGLKVADTVSYPVSEKQMGMF